MKRTVQQLYDEIRSCEEAIEVGEEAKSRKIELEKSLEVVKVDLVKQKKIKWVNKTFDQWFTGEEQEFHIYQTDSGNTYGVWEGLDALNEEDRIHFDEHLNNYHYYGGPCYPDRNHDRAESTECELGFEGDCSLFVLDRDNFD